MSSSLVPLFTPEDQDGAKETPKIRCLSRREMLGVMGSTAIAYALEIFNEVPGRGERVEKLSGTRF